jgi:hypothetical protein
MSEIFAVAPPNQPYPGLMADEEMVSEEEYWRVLANARPTRDDDTVVISGGKRATLEELKAHVAADLARRAAAAEADG